MVALNTGQSRPSGGLAGGIEGRGPHYWVAPRWLLGVLRAVGLNTGQSVAPGGLAGGIEGRGPHYWRTFFGRFGVCAGERPVFARCRRLR